MNQTKNNKLHLPELDYIKGIAIILVIAFHTYGQLSGWHMNLVDRTWLNEYFNEINLSKIFYFLEAYFYLGVNLFVIASGFGLALSELKSNQNSFSWIDFIKKRIIRIIPAALLATILVYLMKLIFLNENPISNFHLNFFPYLAGLNLFSDNWFFPPINGETWFLGLIIQLYLLFPLLLKLLKKLETKQFLLLTLIISVGFRIIYYFFLNQHISTASYGMAIGRIFEFSFGMALAKQTLEQEKLVISKFWIIGLIFFAGYFFSFTYPIADILLGIGLFSFLVTVFQNLNNNKISETLKKTLSLLSTQSYMLFLIHHPIIWIYQKYFPQNIYTIQNQTITFIFTITISLIVAIASNQLLKKLNL